MLGPNCSFSPPLGRRHLLMAGAGLTWPWLAHAQAQTASAQPLKVAAMFALPFNHPIIVRLHQPLMAAAARKEIHYTALENLSPNTYPELLKEFAAQGVRLVIGASTSQEQETEVRRFTQAHPHMAFLWWSQKAPQAPNLSVFDNCIPEPLYLAGMLAAGLTRSNHLGLVGGKDLRDTRIMMNAFLNGAREIKPNIRWSAGVINHWYHPVRAGRMARAMLDRGADVLMAFAHAGVVETAVKHGVPAFSCMSNQQDQFPNTVVAAALWHTEPVLQAVFASLKQGITPAQNYVDFTRMHRKGSSLSSFARFEARLPPGVHARVTERMAQLQSGQFTVQRNPQFTMNATL